MGIICSGHGPAAGQRDKTAANPQFSLMILPGAATLAGGGIRRSDSWVGTGGGKDRVFDPGEMHNFF